MRVVATGGTNTGRVYTITYRAADASGNTTDATATVTVPLDATTLQELATLEVTQPLNSGKLTFSPDGTLLAETP